MSDGMAIRRTPQQAQAEIVRGLALLSTARQAPLGDDTLMVYPGLLVSCNVDDVVEACKELARIAKPNFESAFPTVGAIIERAEEIQRRRSVPAKFTPCGNCENGFAFVNAAGEPWTWSMDVRDRVATQCKCKREWLAARQRSLEGNSS